MELKLNRGSIIGLGGDETFEERDVTVRLDGSARFGMPSHLNLYGVHT